MTCTGQFWEFFKSQAEAVEGVKTVNRSGGDKMDRLLAKSRSEDLYPAIFMLRPKYAVEDNGAGLKLAWFDALFYVLCSGDASDEADEDLAFDQAETIATLLWAMIREQEDGYNVYIDPATKVFMEPITMLTGDSTYGYEVKFRVGLMVNQEVYG